MTGTGSGYLWQIAFHDLPAADAPFVEAVLEPLCVSVAVFRGEDDPVARVEGLCQGEPDRDLLRAALTTAFPDRTDGPPQPTIDLVPPKDWLAENVAEFPPLSVGRFFIHGSHFAGPVPRGRIALELDAGTAFGSGEHGSTAGCLLCLEDIARRDRPGVALDMGCGSGILAIAMAKLWRVPVVASDIDPESRRVTALNAEQNGVGHLISATQGIGYASPLVRRARPYDVIVENILARPVRHLSRDLARHLAPGGKAVLSGLLVRDAPLIVTAHRRQGLRLIRKVAMRGWQTLVFEKP